MTKNKLSININKPLSEVFKFTTDPSKTSIWFKSIFEEVSGEYPPRIGTIYKNRSSITAV